jgi:hypothetical protein
MQRYAHIWAKRLHICQITLKICIVQDLFSRHMFEKSQDFLEISLDFFSTRSNLFQKKPYFLHKERSLVIKFPLFRAKAFVKIFRIFYLMKKALKRADEIVLVRTISSARELSI